MKSDNQQYEKVEKLLHLKRYEHPPEGFYERFLTDLHDRQRVEIMQRSSWSLFWDRVETWFWSVGNRKRVYLIGIAYAAVMIGLYLRAADGDGMVKNGSDSDNSATVAYGIGTPNQNGNEFGSPGSGNKKPSNESLVPAGIKSFLREF